MCGYDELLIGDEDREPGAFRSFVRRSEEGAEREGMDEIDFIVFVAQQSRRELIMKPMIRIGKVASKLANLPFNSTSIQVQNDMIALLESALGDDFEGHIKIVAEIETMRLGSFHRTRRVDATNLLLAEREARIAKVIAYHKSIDPYFELGCLNEDHADALMQIGEAVGCDSPAWPDVVRAVKDVVEEDGIERLGLELHCTGSVPVAVLPVIGRMVRDAYDDGRDLFLVMDPSMLADSGISRAVLANFDGKALVLSFDAEHNLARNASFHEDGMRVDLSFDALYPGCLLPWDAVVQIGVLGDAAVALPEGDDDEEPDLPGRPYPEDAPPVIWKNARVFHEDDGEVPSDWRIVTSPGEDGCFLIVPMEPVTPHLSLVE